jgi:hypothetical protein
MEARFKRRAAPGQNRRQSESSLRPVRGPPRKVGSRITMISTMISPQFFGEKVLESCAHAVSAKIFAKVPRESFLSKSKSPEHGQSS